MKFRFKIATLFIVFYIPQLLLGQSSSFRNLTVEDGLSNNFVRTIHKDKWGYIWFGTLEGLDRFDGIELRSYSDRFPVSKASVNCMANDPSTGLWIGTESGLFYWDFVSDNFQEFKISDDKVAVTTLLVVDNDSTLYAGTSKGIYRVDLINRSSEEIETRYSITDGISIDTHRLFYFTSSNGLVEYTPQKGRIKVYKQSNLTNSPLNRFSSITRDNDFLILGTQSKGLFKFNVSNKQFSESYKLGNDYVLTTRIDKKSENLYVGTDGGGLFIVNLNSGEIKNYTHEISNPSSLSSNSIYSFFVDEEGRYWAGTYSAGLNYGLGLAGDFKVLEYEAGAFLAQKSIRSLYFDESGMQFIGTRDGFYVLDNAGQNHKYFRSEEYQNLRSDIILSFFPISENEVLVGTYGGGVSVFDRRDGSLNVFKAKDVFLSGAVYGFHKDQRDFLWILSLNGLYRLDLQTGEIRNFNENNSAITDNRLYSIFQDSRDRLWLGSMSGVEIFDISSGIPQLISTDVNLPTFKTGYFFEDSNSNIWIATEQGGLFKMSGDLSKLDRYTEADGLPNNSVSAITEYPEGILWISTLKGFSRFDVDKNKFESYSVSDGLPGLVFNPGAVINSAESEEDIWFGNEKGLVHFNPDSVGNNEIIPKIRISDFYIDGTIERPGPESVIDRPVESISKIELEGNQNSFGFRFIALNYFSSPENKYYYRLLGKDDGWKILEEANRVFFQGIKPGQYVFQVCLATAEGEPDEENIASVSVRIVPLFYQNPYIMGLLILVLIAGVSLLFFMIRRLRRRIAEEQKRRREKELKEKYESSRLSIKRSKEILEQVQRYMTEREVFLNADLKISDVARDLDCSPHDISQAINQNLDKSFNDFVNHFRVEAVKAGMVDPKYSKYTLVALAQKCGFNSKTSFYRIFKKETGQTPAEYLKGVKKEI